jgi:hypothetical protein
MPEYRQASDGRRTRKMPAADFTIHLRGSRHIDEMEVPGQIALLRSDWLSADEPLHQGFPLTGVFAHGWSLAIASELAAQMGSGTVVRFQAKNG